MMAVVQGGRVLVENRVDYPDGTKLELEMYGPDDPADKDGALSPEERAARDAELAKRYREYKAGGKMCTSAEMWARIEAARR